MILSPETNYLDRNFLAFIRAFVSHNAINAFLPDDCNLAFNLSLTADPGDVDLEQVAPVGGLQAVGEVAVRRAGPQTRKREELCNENHKISTRDFVLKCGGR
jgi:hypothetical protein